MEFLAPLHHQIVHTPIALLVFSLVFDLIGRALDAEWWRKAAMAMLVVGMLGAAAAVVSGNEASEGAEERQGIPEDVVDAHGDMGKLTLWLAIGAVATRAAAPALGPARAVVAGLAFLLHLATVGTLVVTGYRGGELVYRHGAGVTLHGKLLRHSQAGHDTAGAEAEPGARSHEASERPGEHGANPR